MPCLHANVVATIFCSYTWCLVTVVTSHSVCNKIDDSSFEMLEQVKNELTFFRHINSITTNVLLLISQNESGKK